MSNNFTISLASVRLSIQRFPCLFGAQHGHEVVGPGLSLFRASIFVIPLLFVRKPIGSHGTVSQKPEIFCGRHVFQSPLSPSFLKFGLRQKQVIPTPLLCKKVFVTRFFIQHIDGTQQILSVL